MFIPRNTFGSAAAAAPFRAAASHIHFRSTGPSSPTIDSVIGGCVLADGCPAPVIRPRPAVALATAAALQTPKSKPMREV